MRTFAGLFVGGTVAVVILKLLAALALPFLGTLLGFVMTVVKFGLIALVAYFVYTMVFKRRRQEAEDT